MEDLSDIRFTPNDEWVRLEGETIRVGISDFAQGRLGDIVHVDLPEPDDHHYEPDEDAGVIESLSGSIEFHAPLAGMITAINSNLLSNPELVSVDPYGAGWLVEMKPDDIGGYDELLDVNEYESGLPEEDEE